MKRIFKDSCPHHVYCKGKDGNIIFYSNADCLFYITLYSCLAQRYGITTSAFSLMPNHTHSQQQAPDRKNFLLFNLELQSIFTRGYNSRHRREGALFERPFGSVPKSGEKYIKNNLSYINNNGAAGNLSKGVLDYRWNLMAYHNDNHPFSDKIITSGASKRLREALKYVLKLHSENKYLDYRIQDMLFKGLNRKEKAQLTDFIVAEYNFLDYGLAVRLFGSIEAALSAMDANTGSEHDLKEEWEDYSDYRRMIGKTREYGLEMDRVNFETMDRDIVFDLVNILSRICRDKRKISRFLHLKLAKTGNTEEIQW